MSADRAFRIAFPVVTLPAHMGGEKAVVIQSLIKKGEPQVSFATVISWSGKVFVNLPIATVEIQRGATPDRRCNLQQVKSFDGEAPLLGGESHIIVPA